MANTYTKISTVTIGSGGASTATFTSIPQTYTDLLLKISMRSTATGLYNGAARLTFNSSTGSDYTLRRIYGTGTVAGSNTQASVAYVRISNNQASASNTANTFGNTEIYIPNYTSSVAKSFSEDSVSESNITEGYPQLSADIWNPSSNTAITSITLTSETDLFAEYSTFTLYGIASGTAGAKATGGIISSDTNYWYHTFTSSGTFTPNQSLTCDYLVVAGGGGGGGGGGDAGGGGGAGGLRSTVTATGGGGSLETPLSLSATGYTVTIGAGGTRGLTTTSTFSTNGSNSVFSTITSTGGGRGAGYRNTGGSYAATSGGSGGGGRNATYPNGSGTTNQGYAGGAGSDSNTTYAGGGGGGAGAVGGNGVSSTGIAGSGGAGVTTVISGTSTTYAGGGGGSANAGSPTGGAGGAGGGGTGATGTATAGTAGTPNTGSGGGGGSTAGGGNGASGIVIIRYAK